MAKPIYTPEEQAQWEKNMKQYQISTGQDPAKHGRTPFRIFDPGKGDPWRELHLVDADNRGVTSLGPLQDPTDMSLGNALFLMECANNHETLVQQVADLEEANRSLRAENQSLLAEITDLRQKLEEVKGEV